MIQSSTTITLEALAAHYGFEYMSWDATDLSSRSYSFDAESYDFETEGDKGWAVAYHPDIETQLEDYDIVDLPGSQGRDAMVSASIDTDGDISLTFAHDVEDMDERAQAALLVRLNEDLAPYGIVLDADDVEDESKMIDKGGDSWEKLLAVFEIDSDIFDEDGEDNRDDWHPIYNRFYPLPQGYRGGECWHRAMCGMTLVNVDSELGLALTGCGQDMTWEICRTYLQCGYLPPYEYACRLPRICGQGTSPEAKMVLAGCRITIERMRDSAARALEDLAKVEEWSEQYEAERQSRQAS